VFRAHRGGRCRSPPARDFLSYPDEILDDSCGYEILVTFPIQREYQTTFFDPQGNVTRVVITGRLVVTFMNVATGESLTANISGPAHFGFRSGDTSEGRQGGQIGSKPGLIVFSGRQDWQTGALLGHVHTDVCMALAP
jgi:hypothetical protein